MKTSTLNLIVYGLTSLVILLAPYQVKAQQDTRFFCGEDANGEHTTYANRGKGNVPIVTWRSDFFGGSGWTAERRCNEVSARFQAFDESGRLEYLATGAVNRYPVICAASYLGGRCEDGNVLITLHPDASPDTVLMELTNTRGRVNSGPIVQSGRRVFIDVDVLIESRSASRHRTGSTTPSYSGGQSERLDDDDRNW